MQYADKADQLERDLGVYHPLKALKAALNRRDDYHEVTPFHVGVGRDRLAELRQRGLGTEDAVIVLLMRNSRIESLAKAAGEAVEDLAANVRARLRELSDLDPLIGESQRTLNLWWRV